MNMQKIEELVKLVDEVNGKGRFKPEQESLEQFRCPKWYRNDKFGIFIHWGVYSVPAFGTEWYPRFMYMKGTKEFEHHRKTYGDQKIFGYKDFIPMFKAEKFNPAVWADLIAESGAKFVVPVAEHHDGFQMYKSEISSLNSVELGPKRDIIGELSCEFAKRNLTLGVSSHRAEHNWFFSEGMKFDSDVRDAKNCDLYGVHDEFPGTMPITEHHLYQLNLPSVKAQKDWLARTVELVNNYKPSLIYFDWWINSLGYKDVLKKFVAYYYNKCDEWGIEGAINYKYQAMTPDTGIFDVERGQLAEIFPQFWQTDTATAKNSWGYTENNDFKNSNDLICDLVDVVSKNGALLLNIGPRPDGSITDEDQKLLRDIGRWLKVNGEAIYDSRPHITFGEGPTKVSDGAFTDTNRQAFTTSDIRFTTKENVIYAIVLGGNLDGVFKSHSLAKLSNNAPLAIKKVELLGYGEIEFQWTTDSLRCELPEQERSNTPYVIKVIS